ncbi:LysR family transcriptional regulator, cyn operon transcriptional activator [Pseudomonas sp. NFACC23-1]|nr:LysR family transcriptional regulator, cyn operon transcriptional activator [Pseudomonas sp. NFACC17-2]SEI79180.1 LysR family transcriptional regulator, cyn operon transcriptional activator [Pseudomonas sp. NFACC23-1]SFW91110.1 LysR family transcriptional regulator, cyn operon transcriptional activator [Pseudomonas sp. NFACC16-2]
MAKTMLARHVQYFLAVAEHLSFTKAAAALHVSQPALSQQVRQLEESLGAQLFDRSGRTTRLTDAGDVYLLYARRAYQQLREAKRAIHDVSDLTRGSLRLAVTPTFTTYLVGPVIEAFHSRYPKITLNLKEISQERIEELLLAGELDAGIAFDEINTPNIDAVPLLNETLALVVSRKHRLAEERSIGLQDLNAESLILLSPEFATREQIDRYFRTHAIHPQVQMEANALGAVIEIVRRTNLSTLLPAKIALAHDDLVAIALEPERLQRTAVLMRRKDAFQSAAMRVFIEVAKEVAIQLNV